MPDRTAPAFAAWPDLASRALAGSVVAANDETFASREHLIRPEAPVFSPTEFGPKGKVYDGWETRRRREDGFDWAVVRLGVPGVVRGIVVDTAWFTGNFPPQVSVEALADDDQPSAEELVEADWQPLVPRSPAAGDTANTYAVDDPRRWTHVRLSIHPDGGVARLRVHGEPRPDPRFLAGTVDCAALENGGDVVACSDAFYASARNLVLPGPARSMAEGWENARRRGTGNDWVTVRLAGRAQVRHVEVDTSYFVGNAPGAFRLQACDTGDAGAVDGATWWDLVPLRRCLPDARQRLLVEDSRPASHVRLDVFPDGGVSRLRVWGELLRGG
jgi:allantoicase